MSTDSATASYNSATGLCNEGENRGVEQWDARRFV